MLALILVLVILESLLVLTTTSSSDTWLIMDYSFRSSVGEDVYPGSRDAKLVIIARYMGSDEALSPLACLATSDWFKPSISSCVTARDHDGNYQYAVKPGDVVLFTFTLNVDLNATPGYHIATINISFYNPRLGVYLWEIEQIELYVHNYPEMEISIRDVYFSPHAYPGACPVNVIIGLSNNGRSDVIYMRIILELPSVLASPAVLNFTYPYN